MSKEPDVLRIEEPGRYGSPEDGANYSVPDPQMKLGISVDAMTALQSSFSNLENDIVKLQQMCDDVERVSAVISSWANVVDATIQAIAPAIMAYAQARAVKVQPRATRPINQIVDSIVNVIRAPKDQRLEPIAEVVKLIGGAL